MTRVINVYKDKGLPYVFIGRPSIYGNPYQIGEHGTRAQVIEKYRRYFNERIKTDAIFKEAIHELRGKTLGCFCSPLDCHGHIIAEYLNAHGC